MLVLKNGGPFKDEVRKIEKLLEIRALIFFTFYMAGRAIFPIFGDANWQKAFRDRRDIDFYN